MLTVFSDLHCPWAYVFSIRLRRALAALADPPPVRWRSWPLELVNERGTPWATVTAEIPALAQLEPDSFRLPRRETWPSTLLPAMEAVKVAEALGGPSAADRYDAAARHAFFVGRCDLSIRPTLLALATEAGLSAERFAELFDDGGHRRAVLEDFREGGRLGVKGSPHVFLPDGSGHFNPGIGSLEFPHGIPVIRDVDEGAIARLVERAAAA
jgi:predicted DsbA family dithiol-disulfide isomerase